MKKVIKPLILLIIFLYLGLFFFYNNGYYESKIKREKDMMDEMVLKYENDLKNGIDVTKKDYTIPKKDYTNAFSKTMLKVSSKFENIIDGGIKYLFKKMNNMVNK